MKLPSTEVRLVRKECYATLGEVGNSKLEIQALEKREEEDGLADDFKLEEVMNPCDHPHGGEGKAPVGRAGPVTPWGKLHLV